MGASLLDRIKQITPYKLEKQNLFSYEVCIMWTISKRYSVIGLQIWIRRNVKLTRLCKLCHSQIWSMWRTWKNGRCHMGNQWRMFRVLVSVPETSYSKWIFCRYKLESYEYMDICVLHAYQLDKKITYMRLSTSAYNSCSECTE